MTSQSPRPRLQSDAPIPVPGLPVAPINNGLLVRVNRMVQIFISNDLSDDPNLSIYCAYGQVDGRRVTDLTPFAYWDEALLVMLSELIEDGHVRIPGSCPGRQYFAHVDHNKWYMGLTLVTRNRFSRRQLFEARMTGLVGKATRLPLWEGAYMSRPTRPFMATSPGEALLLALRLMHGEIAAN